MNARASLFAAVLVLAPLAVPAAEAPAARNPQQERMATCNATAKQKALAGDARKAFMKDCLAGKPAAPATPQERMKACNAQAGERKLSGDARRQFLSDCLKSK